MSCTSESITKRKGFFFKKKIKYETKKYLRYKKIEAAKLPYNTKLKEFITSRHLSILGTFIELLIVFSIKVNILYLLYSTAWSCCLLHLIKQNCLLKTFLILMILKTHCLSITPKMTKKVETKLDLSEAPHDGCISVVGLKKCKLEFSYILAEFFNMCLKDC